MSLEDKLLNIPKSCGCYLFKNEKNQVIYVGKSKFLPNRVKTYFRENFDDDKGRLLKETIKDVEFITTLNEGEAFLLEDDLIKLYQPKFNVKGKDDRTKRWYVGFTNDIFPKLEIYPRKVDDGIEVLCEFTNSNTCYEVFQLIHDIVNLRTCSYNLTSKNIESGKFRSCLDFHIGRCDSPCTNLINKFQYKQNCDTVKELFSFKFDSVIIKLKNLMYQLSSKLEFEKCQLIKNKIEKISILKEKLEPIRIQQSVNECKKIKDMLELKNVPLVIEAFDNSHHGGECQVSCCVKFVNGVPEKSSYRTFNIKTVKGPDDYASFYEVLSRRFKRLISEKKELPSLILIDGGVGQLNVSMTVLKELNLDDKIDLISISKNDKHKSETIHLTNGKEIKIGQNRELFYLSRIQDEVHRFTVGFHRKQKSKKMIN
jgi:excinuclease UvrABC nuclease subunit